MRRRLDGALPPLSQAVKDRDVARAEELLKNLEVRIGHARQKLHSRTLDRLMNVRRDQVKLAYLIGAEHGTVEILKLLERYDSAFFNYSNLRKIEQVPHMVAARAGQKDILEYLCGFDDVSAALDIQRQGHTALSLAAENGHAETLTYLLSVYRKHQKYRMNIDQRLDDLGYNCTALSKAVAAGQVECARRLIEAGASLQDLESERGHSVFRVLGLAQAADYNEAIVSLLLEQGVAVDMHDPSKPLLNRIEPKLRADMKLANAENPCLQQIKADIASKILPELVRLVRAGLDAYEDGVSKAPKSEVGTHAGKGLRRAKTAREKLDFIISDQNEVPAEEKVGQVLRVLGECIGLKAPRTIREHSLARVLPNYMIAGLSYPQGMELIKSSRASKIASLGQRLFKAKPFNTPARIFMRRLLGSLAHGCGLEYSETQMVSDAEFKVEVESRATSQRVTSGRDEPDGAGDERLADDTVSSSHSPRGSDGSG